MQFLNKMCTKDNENVAKRTINNEVIFGIKGLKNECSQLTKEVNMEDLYETRLSKQP